MATTTAHADVSADAIEQLYADSRRPDWPPLAELRRHYAIYASLRGRALALERGQPLPPAAPSPPPAPALTTRLHHPPQFDHKRLAAGEREDD
ncbi:hypothetical protein SNE35_28780 [Paucibacter sp. R3-3]|uniref:Uncharacterized protein n=1 Tax=Roseateles agri TaxID=3098619 RepID=A0ABU5DS97_9BURK|nr:hypothetical protein [Paucibacter sp. R3-3]MDY0748530.1 hypothetical protein [Paucibacter sp. R3-3]